MPKALWCSSSQIRVRRPLTPSSPLDTLKLYLAALICDALKLGRLILMLTLLGCSRDKPAPLTDLFPQADRLPGWTAVGSVEVFDRDNLYDLVNGQAESFFAYGFEQVAVQVYDSKEGATLDVEIWRVETPADAYGLFSASLAGGPAPVGNDGDTDPGRRVAFWQNRYFVTARARQKVPDDTLQAFAQSISEALPPSSSEERPALLDRLPSEGLAARSALFFHQEISIQDRLWLGGQNPLGLSPGTEGVLAQYDIGTGMAQLLLVQYTGSGPASDALAALNGSLVDGLVIADSRNSLLGAVFGDMDAASAEEFLAEALK